MRSALRNLKRGQRGVSAIIGGLIMMSALFGLTTYVLVHKAQQGQMQAQGLMDAMRQAEKRQAQLIDFSYSSGEGGNLHVYISNYGWEDAWIRKAWVDGKLVDSTDLGTYNAFTGDPYGNNKVPSRRFTRVEIRNLDSYTSVGSFPFAILTKSNSVYKWEVST